MEWSEVIANPVLNNLPFKIELNRWGNILMSPASNKHGIYQALLVKNFIYVSDKGYSITECSIQTKNGVKVADVAWGSASFFKSQGYTTPYKKSPEIVVEIFSPSNTYLEMDEKRELYFSQGAKEFWLCNEGKITFFDHSGTVEKSNLLTDFPNKLEIDFI